MCVVLLFVHHLVRINIDDYSRKIWVYLLKNKYEFFGGFKKFKAFVDNGSGHFLKTLRSDRGGEFMSKDFVRFCEAYGIRKKLTASYSPQQNRVAKRKNRIILNGSKHA